jgi:hypothetical protein
VFSCGAGAGSAGEGIKFSDTSSAFKEGKTITLKLNWVIFMPVKFIALICARTSTACPIKSV